MNKLLEEYREKIKESPLIGQLPINKKIIGKNSQVLLKETVVNDAYRVEMWAHETYVVMNRPFNLGNLELPDEEFSFASTVESVKAKCFLKCMELSGELDLQNSSVEKQFSVLTFNIKANVNLVLNFKIQNFQHKITLKSGDSSINCPYTEGNVMDIVDIELGIQQKEIQPEPIAASAAPGVDAFAQDMPKFSGSMNFDYSYMEVNCKVCTYLNVGRQSCEMCGTDLYK